MNRPRLVLVLFAVLVAGCSTTIKRTGALDSFTVPKQWTAGETLTDAKGGDWWSYFGDPQLDRAVTTALADNIDLRAAVARVEAARQDVRIAGADLYPSAGVSLSNGYQRMNYVGLPVPGGEDQVLRSTSSSANFGIDLSWEADLWGRVRAGKMGAVSTYEAREADLSGARLSLTAQVSKAWFTAIEADQQVALSRATVASFTTSTERVRARFEMGLRPALDLRLALTELGRAQALLEQRLEQRDRAIRQLEILMGGYPNGELPLSEDLPNMPDMVPAGLPSELVNRRPDIVVAERTFFAADTRIHQAKADLKPRFSLTTGTGTASNELRDIVNFDRIIWNFAANLSQPIFNGGRLRATVKKNEALSREAAANYESKLLVAYNEVESALAAESMLARREKALRAATEQSTAARKLSEERYRLGLTDIITLLSSQRTALNTEAEWLSLRRLRLENRVNLHLALGGGFEAQPGISHKQQQKNQKQKDGGKS